MRTDHHMVDRPDVRDRTASADGPPHAGVVAGPSEWQLSLISRLRRVEGQIRGIQRMVERGASCSDVLTQISSATGALQRAGALVLETRLKECAHDALARGDDAVVSELIELMLRFSRTGPAAKD